MLRIYTKRIQGIKIETKTYKVALDLSIKFGVDKLWPMAKSGLLLIFVNKVLLDHSYGTFVLLPMVSFILQWCSSCDTDQTAHKA